MQQQDYTRVEQQYYRQRKQTSGWQNLVQVLSSGILSSADDEDGRRFLALMGSNEALWQIALVAVREGANGYRPKAGRLRCHSAGRKVVAKAC